jgi:hypothetical protein
VLKAPQFPAEKIGTTVRLAKDESGTHPYMIRVPGEYRANKKSPLLIYLSGGGGLAIDGVNTGAGAVEETDYLVLYPQAGDYWWQPGIRSRVDRLLTQVLHEFNVDTNRIYIAGFSKNMREVLEKFDFDNEPAVRLKVATQKRGLDSMTRQLDDAMDAWRHAILEKNADTVLALDRATEAAVERARVWYVAITQSYSKTPSGAAGWPTVASPMARSRASGAIGSRNCRACWPRPTLW